jgi:uncharacterized protein (UPF0332 family)
LNDVETPSESQPAATDDDDVAQRLFDDAQRYWIEPEIQRRQATGLVPVGEKIKLVAAEIVSRIDPSTHDRERVDVRLNAEVRAMVRVQGTGGTSLPLYGYCGGWDNIEDVHLPPPDDDCAFVVIFQSGDGLVIKADKRHRVGTVARMADTAREFLESAQTSLDASRLHPFADDLLAAVELVAKGSLYWCFETRFWKSKSHQAVGKRLYMSAHKGDVPAEYAQLQRRLLELRGPARYGEGALKLSTEEAAEMLRAAWAMHQRLATTGK